MTATTPTAMIFDYNQNLVYTYNCDFDRFHDGGPYQRTEKAVDFRRELVEKKLAPRMELLHETRSKIIVND
jgi:hypothetical protein